MNINEHIRSLIPKTVKYTACFVIITILPAMAHVYKRGVQPDYDVLFELWWVPLVAAVLIFKALLIKTLLEYADGTEQSEKVKDTTA